MSGSTDEQSRGKRNEYPRHSRLFHVSHLARAVKQVSDIEGDLGGSGLTMPRAALKFVQANPAVGTIISGIGNVQQAGANIMACDLPTMSPALVAQLPERAWLSGFWNGDR